MLQWYHRGLSPCYRSSLMGSSWISPPKWTCQLRYINAFHGQKPWTCFKHRLPYKLPRPNRCLPTSPNIEKNHFEVPGAFQLVPAFGNMDAFLPTRAQFQPFMMHTWPSGSTPGCLGQTTGPMEAVPWLTIRNWNCSCHPPHGNWLLLSLPQFDNLTIAHYGLGVSGFVLAKFAPVWLLILRWRCRLWAPRIWTWLFRARRI